MPSPQGSSFWDAVRSWADEAGLLLPADEDRPRPTVPQAVCDSCPICQAAATLDQVNPQVLVDITEVARSVITGLGSALASAADQRTVDGQPEGPQDQDPQDQDPQDQDPQDQDPQDQDPQDAQD